MSKDIDFIKTISEEVVDYLVEETSVVLLKYRLVKQKLTYMENL